MNEVQKRDIWTRVRDHCDQNSGVFTADLVDGILREMKLIDAEWTGSEGLPLICGVRASALKAIRRWARIDKRGISLHTYKTAYASASWRLEDIRQDGLRRLNDVAKIMERWNEKIERSLESLRAITTEFGESYGLTEPQVEFLSKKTARTIDRASVELRADLSFFLGELAGSWPDHAKRLIPAPPQEMKKIG